jgi:ceramide glucosyltransferase
VHAPLLVSILAAFLFGSLVYCALMILAAQRYVAQPRAEGCCHPISVLKPLSGSDEGLEANLRSFFEQDHPEFELLFAVRELEDPAVPILQALQREFPQVPSRLIVTGEPRFSNAKVWSLHCMQAETKYDLLVMSDSDIRVRRGFLRSIAAEFEDQNIAVATCPYRAMAGRSLWSTLEAEGMNTEFLGGLLVARMLEGVKFTVGPTVAARKSAIEAIGGFRRLKDYLAEDFVMGKFAAEAGFGVVLSKTIVEHRIGSEDLRANAAHRIRWARSTRRSRPLGYIGQIFTHPLALCLLLVAAHPAWWLALIPTIVLRACAAWSMGRVLKARPNWLLLPLQDLLSFGFWMAGFYGNTIVWRGRRYLLYSDGRFTPLSEPRA